MFKLFKKKDIKELVNSNKLKELEKRLTPLTVNNPDKDGKTAFYYALHANSTDVVKLLLKKNATLAYREDEEHAFAKDVINTFNPIILDVLLKHGLILPQEIDRLPLLHYCITRRCRNYHFFSYLLDNGFDINLLDEDGYSPLAFALKQPSADPVFIQLLIDKGADVGYAGGKSQKPIFCLINSKMSEAEKKRLLLLLIENDEKDWRRYAYELISAVVTQKSANMFLTMLDNWPQAESIPNNELDLFLTPRYFTPKQQAELIKLDSEKQLFLPVSPDILVCNKEALKPNLISAQNLFDYILNVDIPIDEKKALFEECEKSGLNINAPGKINDKLLIPLCALLERHGSDKLVITHMIDLIDVGIAIESSEESALLYAADHHLLEVVDILLSKGANPLFVDKLGESFLSKLTNKENKSLGQHFFRQFFSIFSVLITSVNSEQKKQLLYGKFLFKPSEDEPRQVSIMEWALLQDDFERRSLIQYLLKSPCCWDVYTLIDALDRSKAPLFLHLIDCGEDALLQCLLDAYPDYMMPEGFAVFFNALKRNMPLGILKQIVDRTVDVNVTETFPINNALYASRRQNYLCALPSLVTPSDEANYLELAQILIERGADINQPVEYALLEKDERDTLVDSSFLLECVFRDSIVLFDWAVQNGVVLDRYYGPKNATLTLCICSFNGDESKLLKFLDKLKEYDVLHINTPNTIGKTPVIEAAQKCQPRVAEWLIKEGGKVNIIGGFNGTTPLIAAIVNWMDKKSDDRLSTVEVLLNNGADCNMTDTSQETPLMNAAFRGCLSVVRLLLASPNILVNELDKEGRNAIDHAIQGAFDYEYRKKTVMNEPIKLQIIQALAQNGANLNNIPYSSYPALIEAVVRGYMQLFTTLIDCGADINLKDKNGNTALMVALEQGRSSFIKMLLHHQSIDLKLQNDLGENLWHIAMYCNIKHDAIQVLEQLRMNQIALCVNKYGQHPLHIAVANGQQELLLHLLDDSDDVNIKDHEGRTPLFYVVTSDYLTTQQRLDVAALLIDNGADVNSKNHAGSSILKLCQMRNMTELENVLITNGANPDSGKRIIGF